MGHGTPYEMSWAGLLQYLLLTVCVRKTLCNTVQFSVQEELEPGVLVGSLSEYFKPPYKLLDSEFLQVDATSGNLYTTKQRMDREQRCPDTSGECIIMHNAITGPSGELTQIPIIITDCNDNAPTFEFSEIHLNVSEDIPVGTSLLLDYQAQDEDAGTNAQLKYKLKGSGGVFDITVVEDESLIMLVVQTALDRETKDIYDMQLVATDCGKQPLSASAALIVTVTDIDDNCPSFSPDSPRSIIIPENTPKDTVVAQIIATDADIGPNAEIVYSLSPKVSERAKELLKLDSHLGYIKLTRDLQDEDSEELLIIVLASSHHCPTADTQVTISVLPKANQKLTIRLGFIAEHQGQTIVIPENQPPTALAVLELEGDSSFKGSSLAITGDVPFSLTPQSGKYLLSTSKPLDYEMKREYHISVVVQGISSERSVISPSGREIRVMVGDVNDNAPHFLQSHYQLEVDENNQPGLTLLQVSASDADSRENGRVTYRLDKYTSAIFHVDTVTGHLSVRIPLDREQKSEYKVMVFARDSGSPQLESQATVIIRVLDQNDNAPVFLTPHFIFFIPENVAPFAQVGKIEVRDPDEGENGNIEVQVVNSSKPFVVDNTQRMLRTTSNLDREIEDQHELYLSVTDKGLLVSLTSTARVTIFVEDVNDNQPKVILPSSNSSCTTISPGTSAGTTVTKIYAMDEDSGLNSEITYSAVAPEYVHDSSPFQVDSKSGNVILRQSLLQEDMRMHHLFIVVRDNGKPAPLYTTVWVNLLVNESTESCHLERLPAWTGTSDLVRGPSQTPICQLETTGLTPVIYFYLALSMMVVAVILFLLTVCLYVRHRKCQKKIPLRLRDKYDSDE